MAMTDEDYLWEVWENINDGLPPPKDESGWLVSPKFAFLYAKYVRGTRWSEDEESIFYSDFKFLYNYSYWIITELKKPCPKNIINMVAARNLGEMSEEDERWSALFFELIKNNKKKKR